MALDLLTRDAAAVRAHHPVGPAPSPDMSYKVTSVNVVEVLPVLKVVKPIRRIRAIRLSNDTKHDITVTALMLPFLALLTLDLACVSLWASLPGCAVIVASMIVSVIVFASHSAGHSTTPSTSSTSSTPARNPGRKTRR